jgi:hypothetical protein
MLPETVSLIGALTRLPSELSTAADVSRALELDRFSAVDSTGHPNAYLEITRAAP